jgi:methionine-gamma-lyase
MSDHSFEYNGISSAAIHTASQIFPEYAHLVPIYASSTFTFDNADQGRDRFSGAEPGYVYSRWGNPTFKVAEETICALEAFHLKGKDGKQLQLKALLHSSGQAAMSTMFFSNLKAGDKLITHYSLYGGTQELVQKVLNDAGVETLIVDFRNVEEVEKALTENPGIKMMHIETPANPTNNCVDIEVLSALGKKFGLTVSVDNTFATPYLQQPFKYDVDFVFHSTTKFLNGHGTAIGGILIGRDVEFMNTRATKWHRLLGGNSNPFDAFMLIMGMKTLEVRMKQHCENAMKVARFLDEHPSIEKVHYVGLEQHPDFAIAKKQMTHPGAMLSYELKGGLETGKKFIDKLKMCVRAVSLGTVDTLVSHPASMSHVGIPKAEREKYGITDGLIRMSVGIENIEDIIADLSQALQS